MNDKRHLLIINVVKSEVLQTQKYMYIQNNNGLYTSCQETSFFKTFFFYIFLADLCSMIYSYIHTYPLIQFPTLWTLSNYTLILLTIWICYLTFFYPLFCSFEILCSLLKSSSITCTFTYLLSTLALFYFSCFILNYF